MDFGDTYIEKDRFYETKTNVKRKRILSYFGFPFSEERIVYDKDIGIMIVFLDYDLTGVIWVQPLADLFTTILTVIFALKINRDLSIEISKTIP